MTPTTNPSPVVTLLQTQRRPVAYALVALGVLFAVLAIWWGVWGWPSRTPTTPDKDADTTLLGKDKEKERPKDKDKDKEQARPHSEDYLPAGIWAGLIAVVCFGGATWLATQPLPTESTSGIVRAELLTFGSLLGFVTSLLGVALAVSWYKSLFRWINEDNVNEARWVLIALAVFVGGLMLMFFSVQIARSEERTNAILRRVAYGFNGVFMGLLLVLVLVTVNVVSFLQVPGTLVTNELAFTGLSEPSKKFLRSLDQPVNAYLVLPEGVSTSFQGIRYKSLYTDCRGMLSQCEDQSPHFKAHYISPGLDTARLSVLLDKVKVADRNKAEYGLYLTFGVNEDSHTFIAATDLITTVPVGQDMELLAFRGEEKLMTQIIARQESGTDATIYFTQNHGELNIDESLRSKRSAVQMLSVLRERKVKLKALELDDANPRVPSDAVMVVVASPNKTIDSNSPTYKALQNYLFPTEPSKAPGKLLAFLPAMVSNQKIAPSGLEPLLAQYGVQVESDSFLVAPLGEFMLDAESVLHPRYLLASASPTAPKALAPVLGNTQYVFEFTRRVRPGQPNPAYTVTPFFEIAEGVQTWIESDITADLNETYRRIRRDREFATTKQFNKNASVPIAVVVTQANPGADPRKREMGKPVAIIIGSDSLITDSAPLPLEIRQVALTSTIDYHRGREVAAGIEPRKLPIYFLTKAPSLGSLFMLLGMLVACVVALGVGVWLSRRK